MSARKVLVRIALVVVLAAGALAVPEWFSTDDIVFGNDFFQYWSAGRFVLAGGNPYDHAALFEFQKTLGWERDIPFITWNPPWAIGLFLPFALLRFAPAVMLWLFVQGALIVASSMALWRELGNGRQRERSMVLLAVLFVPAFLSIIFGQISGWLLVGETLALIGLSRGRLELVGAGMVLLAVKPHFSFLLLVALLVLGLRRRPARLVAGAGIALLVTLGPPLLARPGLLGEYLVTVLNSQPREYVSDTLGAGLRLLVGWDHFWVQFVPLGAGLVWLGYEAVRQRASRGLPGDLVPLLALVSALCAPYGWIFDNVVAIPALAVVWSALCATRTAGDRRRFLIAFGLFEVLLLALHVWLWDPMQWVHGWLPAFLLAAYLRFRREHPEIANRVPELAGARSV